MAYLFLACALVWTLLFLFVMRLFQRAKRLEQELNLLRDVTPTRVATNVEKTAASVASR